MLYFEQHLIENKHHVSIERSMNGSLGEREMLCEHEPQVTVPTAFSGSPKLSRVLYRSDECYNLIETRKHVCYSF